MSDMLRIVLTAVISLVVLFLLTKLMGNKQVSQMNMFDYIVGISIGSIAAEMASELESPLRPAVAMVVYALLAILISWLTSKSLAARRVLTGKPLVLMDNGVIYRKSLQRAKMDLSEFLMFCRIGGYFDLQQIQTAVLEHNGTVTFLPAAAQRPATPADFSLQTRQEQMQTPVILDGCVLPENLKKIGRDSVWLERQLHDADYHAPQEVLLALWDGSSQLSLYPMTPKKNAKNLTDG